MSAVTVGKNGRVYRRRFDHEEALRRYGAGEAIADLAREYGVAWAAVARVVRPSIRKRMDKQARANIERRREPCRGGCGRLVYMHGDRSKRTGYCQSCLAEKAAERRPHGTETSYRYGCRCGACLRAASDAKRLRRERSRRPCSHGCGRMVNTINRPNPSKPLECLPCALARIHGKLQLQEAA